MSGEEAALRVAEATEWQADVILIGGSFGQDPTRRPAVAMVTAAGLVVHFEALDHPLAEPDAMALDRAHLRGTMKA